MADTDGDGTADGKEVEKGFDPTDPSDNGGLLLCEDGSAKDSDQDGLLDCWEEKGFPPDNPVIDLPGMGARSDRKDIFVFVDWLKESFDEVAATSGGTETDCDEHRLEGPNQSICFYQHTHKPRREAMDMVIQAFAQKDDSQKKRLHYICTTVRGLKKLDQTESSLSGRIGRSRSTR